MLPKSCTKVLTILPLVIVLVHADYYAATAGLERLIQVEKFMVENFENYLRAANFKNTFLKSYLNYVQGEINKAKSNGADYFGNPLNAWKAIKRMTRDWRDHYFSNLNVNTENDYMDKFVAHVTKYPVQQPVFDDLIGAAKGVARLQRTYNLDTTRLANGTIVNRQASLQMSASDCFNLGMSLLNVKDFKNGATWLLEARNKFAQESQLARKQGFWAFPFMNDDMILDNLVPAIFENGNSKLALWLVKEQLARNPANAKATEMFQRIQQKIEADRLTLVNDQPPVPIARPDTLEEMYEKTCRGELRQTPSEQRPLRCRYVANRVPFCKIAPLKFEEISLDPFIAYYHEAIYDSEIKKILAATEKKVERSKVGGNINMVSDIRTSKNTWMWYGEYPFLMPLARRLTDITGLSLSNAEALQVANYGIGGHYGPHFDFFEDGSAEFGGRGNRIMTAMFYINDVEFGGATAFPYLRIAVQPVKGSVVIWYNLHRSLELDYRMKHAGCPVIKGSKWIINEWYHSWGQEFYRKCDLYPDGYKSLGFHGLGENLNTRT